MYRQLAKSRFAILLVVLAVSLTGCFDRESKEQSQHPYDETAEARQDISAALSRIGGQKRLLLMFGANWCPDCRRVDASMNQPEITGYLTGHFEIVKVDVGNFDKNMEISQRYGSPTKQGIPAFAIVAGKDSVVRIVQGGELARRHKKGREDFYRWLKTL